MFGIFWPILAVGVVLVIITIAHHLIKLRRGTKNSASRHKHEPQQKPAWLKPPRTAEESVIRQPKPTARQPKPDQAAEAKLIARHNTQASRPNRLRSGLHALQSPASSNMVCSVKIKPREDQEYA